MSLIAVLYCAPDNGVLDTLYLTLIFVGVGCSTKLIVNALSAMFVNLYSYTIFVFFAVLVIIVLTFYFLWNIMITRGGNMANDFIQLLIMQEHQNLKLAEASNWDGVAYIGKRKHVSSLSKIEQLRNPGIYFLLGENNTTGEKTLYIGETENIANRFQTHSCDKKKEWFEDFIIFTSKKGDLNKAHVKYLEAVFIELAKEELKESIITFHTLLL